MIAQSPSPGARVRQGSTVSLVLSKGPPPVALPRPHRVHRGKRPERPAKAPSARDDHARARARGDTRRRHAPGSGARNEAVPGIDRLAVGRRGPALAGADDIHGRPVGPVPDPRHALAARLQDGVQGHVHVHLRVLGAERTRGQPDEGHERGLVRPERGQRPDLDVPDRPGALPGAVSAPAPTPPPCRRRCRTGTSRAARSERRRGGSGCP